MPPSLNVMHTDTRSLPTPAGLLGFPSKALHDRFLSFFKPVLYVRPRDYSKVRRWTVVGMDGIKEL